MLGQACMDVVVNPPRPDEPSYALFIQVKKFLTRNFNILVSVQYAYQK